MNSDTNYLIVDKQLSMKVTNEIKVLEINKLQLYDYKEFDIQETFESSDIATMMYTSGTTGSPKAVLQTYSNHWNSAIASVLIFRFRSARCI